MAEDIDKLIERLRYIRADILARAEREYGRVPTEYQEDAACVDAASTAIKSLRSRVSELEAERDRIERNRDMWKGQSERQATTIRGLRNSVHTAIIELAALVPNPRCVGNDDWPDLLNAADRQCLTDAYIDNGLRAMCRRADAAIQSLRSRVSELEAELHAVKYEVMGGEDVPGSASAATIEDVKAEMERLRRIERNTDTGPQAQVRAEAGASAATDDADAKLLAAFDAVRAEIIDSSLCDASEGLSSLVFSQLSDFRLRLHEYFAHRLAASPTPPAAEAVGKWQDISTAPRDGTQVDLWCTAMGGTISAGGYSRTPDCWFSAGRWWRYDEQHGDDQCRSEVCNVTHWMPLPAPPLQRERGAVAGRDGSSISCALKETPAAASTASDDLVKEIGQSMDVQYAIGSIINNEGSSFTGRGERMDRLVRAVLSSPPVREIVGALDNINMQAVPGPTEGWAMIPKTEWDALDIRSILSRFQSVGGEKQDHADGASAEAVEKVTQPE